VAREVLLEVAGEGGDVGELAAVAVDGEPEGALGEIGRAHV
jgi:hypothetical protein